jgi:LuxR family maltose regulon positive regulatory protein
VQDKLRQAAATSQEVISRLSGRASIHSSRAHSRLGRLSREWNELDLAINHMQQAITLGEQAGQDIYMSPVYLACAQVFWTRGEVRESFAVLDRAEQAAQRLGHRRATEQARAFRAQLELAQGNLAAAERWSEEAGIEVSDEPAYERETDYLMLARLRIAQRRAEEAVGLLERMRAADEAAGRTGNAIAVLALQALAQWQTRNAEQAMRVLGRLLVLTEPEGYVRVLVDEGPPMQALLATWLSSPAQQHGSRGTSASADYVRQLLAAFPVSSSRTPHDTRAGRAGVVSRGPVERRDCRTADCHRGNREDPCQEHLRQVGGP